MNCGAHAACDGFGTHTLGHRILGNLDFLGPRLVVVCFQGLGFRVQGSGFNLRFEGE